MLGRHGHRGWLAALLAVLAKEQVGHEGDQPSTRVLGHLGRGHAQRALAGILDQIMGIDLVAAEAPSQTQEHVMILLNDRLCERCWPDSSNAGLLRHGRSVTSRCGGYASDERDARARVA